MKEIIFILIGIINIIVAFVIYAIYKLIVTKKDSEKRIKELQEEIDAEYTSGTKIANEVLNKYESFRFNYCHKTKDGTICYIFNNNTYFVYLWFYNNVRLEVSIHKNDECLFSKEINKEINEKLVLAFFSIVSNFLADIEFNADAEDCSYRQGQLIGFRSGYVSGYLRGNKDGMGGKFNIPEDNEKIKDIELILEKK